MSAPEASLRAAQAGTGRADVVVVAYETPDLLDACIRSLQAAPVCIGEIVVVDNSRSSRCAELMHMAHPGVRVVRPPQNRGYGAGANAGIAVTSGDMVVVLNADTRVTKDAVAAMYDAMQRHPDVAVIGPRLVGPDGAVQPSCARFPTATGVFVHETGLWKLWPGDRAARSLAPFFEPDADEVVPWVLGAALAVRRDAFQSVGGFDEGFFMYYEEVDLCRRLANAGWSTLFVRGAVVEHVGGASTSRDPVRMQRAMYRSLARYAARHWRDVKQLRLRVAVIATTSLQALTDVARRRPGGARSRLTIAGDAARGWPTEQAGS